MDISQSTLDMLYLYHSSASEEEKIQKLDAWISTVIASNDYGFDRGLLGLGWLISYLIQEELMEGDADEILEDVEDVLYKLTIKEIVHPEYRVSELLYFATYYQQRLEYKSKAHFYRRFTLFESLKLIIEKLNKFLMSEEDTAAPSRIKDQVDIVLKYSYLSKKIIGEKLIEEAFYPAVESLIDFFEDQKCLDGYTEEFAKLYLCVKQYEHPHWEEKIQSIYSEKVQNKVEDPISESAIRWESLSLAYPEKYLPKRDNDDVSVQDKHIIYQYLTNIKPVV